MILLCWWDHCPQKPEHTSQIQFYNCCNQYLLFQSWYSLGWASLTLHQGPGKHWAALLLSLSTLWSSTWVTSWKAYCGCPAALAPWWSELTAPPLQHGHCEVWGSEWWARNRVACTQTPCHYGYQPPGWKPLDLYKANARFISLNIVSFLRFLTADTVRNFSFLDTVWKKGRPCTKKKSMHSVMVPWSLRMGRGTLLGMVVSMRTGPPLMVFCLIAGTSGPYMTSALQASSTITGQF